VDWWGSTQVDRVLMVEPVLNSETLESVEPPLIRRSSDFDLDFSLSSGLVVSRPLLLLEVGPSGSKGYLLMP
jgi:hypothetical protein